jgi:hypothetical protein
MQPSSKFKWAIAVAITFLFFLIVNSFLYPLFNSGDDVFLMYTLAGGYGEAPTNLLHYNYGWHPMLGWAVKTLFNNFSFLNWYTIMLLLLQLLGCSMIFYVFLNKFRFIVAFFFFFILLFFFEVRNLLSLNYTATSWVLTSGATLLLLFRLQTRARMADLFISSFLILIAGLLRLQIAIIVVLLFLPAFFLYCRQHFKKWSLAFAGCFLFLFLLNQQQQSYYSSHIPGWKEQEKLRQALFYSYNRPKRPLQDVARDSMEGAFFRTLFFFDSNFISPKRINEIARARVRNRNFEYSEDKESLYWFFVEMRISILLYAICLIALWRAKILYRVFQKRLIGLPLIILSYGFLFFFLKVTDAVHLGLLMILWIYFVLAISSYSSFDIFSKKKESLFLLLLILPVLWMSVRVFKINEENLRRHSRFACIISQLQKHKDKVFIATDDRIPMNFFYVWHLPRDFSIVNTVYKDRILTGTYLFTLQRYHITNLVQSIYQDKNVFLAGAAFPELGLYYKKHGHPVIISPPLKEFSCFEVRKVSLADSIPK